MKKVIINISSGDGEVMIDEIYRGEGSVEEIVKNDLYENYGKEVEYNEERWNKEKSEYCVDEEDVSDDVYEYWDGEGFSIYRVIEC